MSWSRGDELASISEHGYCAFCDCSVGRTNEIQHVKGGRHQQSMAELRKMVQKGFCEVCQVQLPRSEVSVMQHVRANKHRKIRQQKQEQRVAPASAASQPASQIDPEIAAILSTGRCTLCSVPISPHEDPARIHLNGKQHLMRKRLQAVDWQGQETIDKLTQGAHNKFSVTMQVDDRIVADRSTITLEVGKVHSVRFQLNNVSKTNRGELHRVIGIPPYELQQLGMPIKITGRQMIGIGEAAHLNFSSVQGKANLIGLHRCLVAFQTRTSLLFRSFDIRVVPQGTINELKAMEATFAPYVAKPRKKVEAMWADTDMNVIPGVKPDALTNAKGFYKRPLGFFDLPRRINPEQVKTWLRNVAAPLTPSSYLKRFCTLLQLEEMQMKVDIQDYDRKSPLAIDPRRPNWFRLTVPGLAESRPSVQKGDVILACLSPFTDRLRSGSQIYSGYVHQVEQEHVFLKFHKSFHERHVPGTTYFLRFTFNRIPLRRCHQGVKLIAEHGVERAFATRSAQTAVSSSSTQAGPSAREGTETDDPRECDEWIDREILSKSVTEVGLDSESALTMYQPNKLALLQLATSSQVLVFRVLELNTLPPRLTHLLGLTSVTKYSVGNEAEIGKRFRVEMKGMVDLQRVYMEKYSTSHLPSTQLLAEKFKIHYQKDKSLQVSDWSRWPLDLNQFQYAAKDALVALDIGKAMIGKAVVKDPFSHSSSGQPLSFSRSSFSAASSSASSPTVKFTSDCKLNELQRACVTGIVKGEHSMYPYICFGPPGTGKTTVLVESIQQLLKLHPRSSSSSSSTPTVRILATAPSNSAADLYVQRLSNLNQQDLFRLNAVSRVVRTTPEEVLRYSHIENDSFALVPRERLLSYRVVVTTCVSGSCISGLGCLPGDFSHIFIDEAGHATEPELMATLGGLIDSTQTKVILGGDPEQLGPIIRNDAAIKFGLATSFLERLIRDSKDQPSSPYYRVGGTGAFNSKFMVKLLNNYRSHPEILTVPNRLFYQNELIASADRLDRESLCSWPHWPNSNRDFPLMVHHIEGREQREGESPSWFNMDEALSVMEYVGKLLEHRRFGLALKDIGIITPYNRQAHKLRAMAQSRNWDVSQLKIGSVEEFQGQERKVILISTVRSQLLSLNSFDVKFQLGFVHQPKRMNVALTRAKCALIVVGNAKVLETDKNWAQFLNHCVINRAVIGNYKQPAAAVSESSSSSSTSDSGDEWSQLMRLVERQHARDQQDEVEDDDGSSDDEWEHVRTNSDAPWKGDN